MYSSKSPTYPHLNCQMSCLFTLFTLFQLGPYMPILMNTLENIYGIKDPAPETVFQLKQIFEAMDRPEFLSEIPNVSLSFPFIFHGLISAYFQLVFESRRNRFKYIDAKGMPYADVVGSAHIQDDPASTCSIHSHGTLPDLLRGQSQVDL